MKGWDYFLDLVSVVKLWRQQHMLRMTDDELIETLQGFPAEFQEAVYKMIGER